MSKENDSNQETSNEDLINKAQLQVNKLSKEQVDALIKITQEKEIEAINEAKTFYQNLAYKLNHDDSITFDVKNKNNAIKKVKSILENIDKVIVIANEGVNSKRHHILSNSLPKEKLQKVTKNSYVNEKDFTSFINKAAKNWDKLAKTKNDDKVSGLSIACDHVSSIAQYSLNIIPAAANFAGAIAEYAVMTIVVDSIKNGFSNIAKIYTEGKKNNDLTRAAFGAFNAAITVLDPRIVLAATLDDNDFERLKADKNGAKIAKKVDYLANLTKCQNNVEEEAGKIVQKINLSSKQQEQYEKLKNGIGGVHLAYFIEEQVSKMDRKDRPDLSQLKEYRKDTVKAHKSGIVAKVTGILLGTIGSGTQAIMAPIKTVLNATGNVLYTPVGIVKNYQSNKIDNKGNTKNWAKTRSELREITTNLKEEEARKNFVKSVQKNNTKLTKKAATKVNKPLTRSV